MGKPKDPTMPVGEMKVFYRKTAAGEIDTELDNAIREAVKPFGYLMFASGCSRIDGVRDLALRKRK